MVQGIERLGSLLFLPSERDALAPRTALLYHHLPMAIGFVVVASAILAVCAWNNGGDAKVAGWLCALLGVTALRWQLFRHYRREERDSRYWAALFFYSPSSPPAFGGWAPSSFSMPTPVFVSSP